MDRAPLWMPWLAQERPGEDLWPGMRQEQPRESFAGPSVAGSPRHLSRIPSGFQRQGEGPEKRGQRRRGPLKESARTQAEEEVAESRWQLEERYQQEMESWKSALFHQHQEDLREMEEDLAGRHTSEMEELKWNYEARLGELLMAEDECHEYREAWEAQQQSISIQREDIELLEKENARLRDIGVQAEMHFKKELELVKQELLQKHADELARTRQKVQELEQAHQVENEEWKSKWEDLKRKSKEELSLVCKELEDKVELEKCLAEQQNRVQLLEAQVKQLGEQSKKELENKTELEESLVEQLNRVRQLEAQVRRLEEQSQEDLAATVSSFKAALGDKEQEVEQLSGQVGSLQAKLEETTQQWKSEMVASAAKIKCLVSEKEQVQLELAMEKASKAALEVQLQKISSELRAEISGLQEEVVRAHELVKEKEQELEELQLRNVSHSKELRDLPRTVSMVEKELPDKKKELAQGGEDVSGAGKELTSTHARIPEKDKSKEGCREQMSRGFRKGEEETGLIHSSEQEMSVMHQQLQEKEIETKNLGQLALEESKELKKRRRLLQPKMAMAISWAAEGYLTSQAEAKNYHELAIVKYKGGLSWLWEGFFFQQRRSGSSASKRAAVPLLLGGVCDRGRPPERLDSCFSTHQD